MYKRFDGFITSNGFHKCEYEPCVYIKVEYNNARVFLLLDVDDMLIPCVYIKVEYNNARVCILLYVDNMLIVRKDIAKIDRVKIVLTRI